MERGAQCWSPTAHGFVHGVLQRAGPRHHGMTVAPMLRMRNIESLALHVLPRPCRLHSPGRAQAVAVPTPAVRRPSRRSRAACPAAWRATPAQRCLLTLWAPVAEVFAFQVRRARLRAVRFSRAEGRRPVGELPQEAVGSSARNADLGGSAERRLPSSANGAISVSGT